MREEGKRGEKTHLDMILHLNLMTDRQRIHLIRRLPLVLLLVDISILQLSVETVVRDFERCLSHFRQVDDGVRR
jgi:hypothetical protein